MPALKQGETTTKNDLNVYFYVGGSLSDPFWVTYTLYDCSSGNDEVIGLPDRSPIKFEVGSFYAPWTVPDDEPVGLHKVKWRYKETSTSEEKTDIEEFKVIAQCAGTELVYPASIMYLIQHLRNKLRDINPDRDYHFAPPSSAATIAGFTRTRGYRWTDEGLYMHLVQAVNYVNLVPPDTSFPIEQVPAPWMPIVLMIAMGYALYELGILWINEEFGYNLNGYSLDLTRSDKYISVAQNIQDQANQQLTTAKSRLHYTIGLRQSKYTMSYGGFFGPWTSGRMSIKKWTLGFGTQAGQGFGN
jgi:hypothetical protein